MIPEPPSWLSVEAYRELARLRERL